MMALRASVRLSRTLLCAPLRHGTARHGAGAVAWTALPLGVPALAQRARPLAAKAKKAKGGRKGKGGKPATAGDDADDDDDEHAHEGGDGEEGAGEEGDTSKFADHIEQAIDSFRRDLVPIIPGRATPHMLDHVSVVHPDTKTALPMLSAARVVVRDPQRLELTVFDPQLVTAVVKAVAAAGMELNPYAERNVVHVPVPRPTAEQRRAMVKSVHALAEKARERVRRVRQQALKAGKNLKHTAGADEAKRYEGEVQALVERGTKSIGEVAAHKEKDLLDG